MTEKGKRFPLSLSSVVEKASHASDVRPLTKIKIATPQTATQNAAQNSAKYTSKQVSQTTRIHAVTNGARSFLVTDPRR